jgi:hypothetical protein
MKMLAVFNKIYIEIIIQSQMIIDFTVHQLLVRTKLEELKNSKSLAHKQELCI